MPAMKAFFSWWELYSILEADFVCVLHVLTASFDSWGDGFDFILQPKNIHLIFGNLMDKFTLRGVAHIAQPTADYLQCYSVFDQMNSPYECTCIPLVWLGTWQAEGFNSSSPVTELVSSFNFMPISGFSLDKVSVANVRVSFEQHTKNVIGFNYVKCT